MIRSLVLASLLGLVMTSIYMLPPCRQVESAIRLEIPSQLGSWITKTYPPSEKELKILAGDTQFAKARCGLRRYEEVSILGPVKTDVVDLSVVLSGHDLANSIHRPERCMPAQGHRNLRISDAQMELSKGRTLPLTRILSEQDVAYGPPEKREHVTLNSVTYYLFVGAERITADHTERTLIDITDRVAKGEAQRWAFITASIPYTNDPERNFGAPLLTLDMADKKIRQLLSELAEHNINWDQISL